MTIRNLVLGAGLAAILWSPLLKAQTAEVATVPFGFHAYSTTLPAGEYTVIKDTMSGIVRLRSNETNKSILLMAPSRKSGNLEDSKLTFRRYGDQYFLAEIWIPGDPAYAFAKGSLEKEMENGGARVAMTYVPLATR
jgi:hypothetical protein